MNKSVIGGASNGFNHLLLKDDVGHSKPSTRVLPPNFFTYGKPEIRDKEGAGDGTILFSIP